jgi:hypothetical protein
MYAMLCIIKSHHALVIAFAGVTIIMGSVVVRRRQEAYHHRQCDCGVDSNDDDYDDDVAYQVPMGRAMSYMFDSDLIYHHPNVVMT